MSDIWDEDFEEKMNDHYRKTAMTDKPQRNEQITRMLDQLSGGVGTFLQEDGVGLSEYVRGLEAEIARLRGLFAMDDEQHAEYIKGLISRHEIRIMKYAEVIDGLRLQLEERDAEIEQLKENVSARSRLQP